MAWKQLICSAREKSIDPLEEFLLAFGAVAVTLEDASDTPIFEPPPGETPLWSEVTLKALFDIGADLEPLLLDLSAKWPEVSVLSIEEVGEQQWERAWLDHFHPIDFGNGLWVVPHHEAPPAGAKTVIRLDPGLAFGTGTHPTTALCLRWIAEQPHLLKREFIDFGCGSGILAIAALKRGAESGIAVDNDPQAITATELNARDNEVDARLQCRLSVPAETPPAEIVFANILSSTLLDLRPLLTSLCRPEGWLIMSGILSYQADEMVEAYSQDFEVVQIAHEDEWVRIDARRRSAVI